MAPETRTTISARHELLRWFSAAVLAGPLGIILHELGHFLTAIALGFERPVLHALSADYGRAEEFWHAFAAGDVNAAAAVYPIGQVGAVTAAGILVSVLLVAGAAVGAPRAGFGRFAGALLVSMALFGSFRWLIGLQYLVLVRPRRPHAFPQFDEFRASVTTGVPVELWVAVSLMVTVAAWAFLIPKLKPRRWMRVGAVFAGTVSGIVLWALIGPHLLP